MENNMFCFQCQETAGCKGCTVRGVCGKQPETARMQDLLVYVTKGISAVTTELRKEGKAISPDIDHLITVNLFTTITNANFDTEAIKARVTETLEEEQKLLAQGIRVTDDAMVVETFTDTKIRLVEGSYENIKITTPEDLLIAEALLTSSTL